MAIFAQAAEPAVALAGFANLTLGALPSLPWREAALLGFPFAGTAAGRLLARRRG